MRLIDADELKEHLFVGFDYDRAIGDGIPKTEEEVLAFECGWNDALKSVVRFAPTVDPVKHGQWKATPYTDYDDTYECSACGACWTFIEGTPKDNEAFYCPHCGAKMDEVEEDGKTD